MLRELVTQPHCCNFGNKICLNHHIVLTLPRMATFLTLHIIFYMVRACMYSRGARDSKIGKKWPESSRILDYILS